MNHPDLEIKPPIGWITPSKAFKPMDVFTGYLMLDTLISNQDRHHENWGLIVSTDNLYLTPTFDHGASLGMNETDETRISKLETSDLGNSIATYVAKSRSALYHSPAGKKPLKTIEAFEQAATLNPLGAAYWLERLEQLNTEIIEIIVDKVPQNIANLHQKNFAKEMIFANRTRLLNLKLYLEL